MNGLASVANVGAVVSNAQFQVAYQGAVLKKTVDVSVTLGENALKLIQSATVAVPTSGAVHDLDVQA